MTVYRMHVGTGQLSIGCVLPVGYVKNTSRALLREASRLASRLRALNFIEPLPEILSYIDIMPITPNDARYHEKYEELTLVTRDPRKYDVSCTVLGDRRRSGHADPDKTSFTVSTYDPITFAHELGHVLGLSHPGNECHEKCSSRIEILHGAFVYEMKPYADDCVHKNNIMGWCYSKLSRGKVSDVVKTNGRTSIAQFSEEDKEFLLKGYAHSSGRLAAQSS
jgi:hypothetical protein